MKQKKPFQKTRDIRLRADRDNKKKATKVNHFGVDEEEDDLSEEEVKTAGEAAKEAEEALEDGTEEEEGEDKP